jgi:hypothetical protein
MGAVQSGEDAMRTAASYIGFIGACIERKANDVTKFVETERRKSITVGPFGTPRTISRNFASLPTPPLSARNRVDRTDHILLSARTIAIQKKAPLFRDDMIEDELPALPGHITRKKLDTNAIDQMIAEDTSSSGGGG